MKEEKKKISFTETLRQAWTPYRRLYGYVAPYKWRFIVGLALGSLFGAASGLIPLVVSWVMSVVFHGSMPAPQALVQHPELMQTGPKFNHFAWICLAIPLIMTARGLAGFGNSYCMNWVSNRVVSDIRNELFAKIVNQSMSFFGKWRAGFLMSRVTNDTNAMQQALTTVSSDAFKQPISIIFALAALLYMDWKFTVVTLLLFPTCILPIQLFGKRARKAVQRQQEDMGQMVVTMQETFAGIRVVKAFARERHQVKTFSRSTSLQFRNAMRMLIAMEATSPLIEILAAFGVGIALLYVYLTNLSAARFFGLIGGIFILYDPIKTLSRIHIVMQRSIAATQGVFNILDSKPEIQDLPDARAITNSGGELELDQVTFRYNETSTDAVKDLSLRIAPGKSYALVGASGAGKSTILSLLLRLYDPAAGAIRLDGQDVRTLTQQSLREQIGLVSQDTFLFHDTIYNNILFGRLNAERDEVYRAAQMAYAHDFIMQQPKGYDTVVGDKGMLLSGGQQQRLAIARAVLKNAPILLLDEATSALDSESEQQIQLALQTLAAGKTVVAIAHRLSTILSSDQIVVMDSGHIKEIGTHAELLAQSGYYRRLYDLQFNRGEDHHAPRPEELFEVVG